MRKDDATDLSEVNMPGKIWKFLGSPTSSSWPAREADSLYSPIYVVIQAVLLGVGFLLKRQMEGYCSRLGFFLYNMSQRIFFIDVILVIRSLSYLRSLERHCARCYG